MAQVNHWDTDYRQVSTSKFESQLDLYTSSRLRFTDHRCNQEMLIAGTPPPGQIGVVIPLNPLGKGVFQGQTLSKVRPTTDISSFLDDIRIAV